MEIMKDKVIGLDTNIFIYYFGQHPEFGTPAKNIFTLLAHSKIKAVTSIITLTELLSIKAPESDIKTLHTLFLETPNLKIINLDQSIGLESARIKRTYGFRIPDSIQIATCLQSKATTFITNDKRLQSCKEIKIILPGQFT